MSSTKADLQSIARRIREARKALDLNQENLAGRLGIDQTTVSKWEQGKARPQPEMFVRLASIGDAETRRFFLSQAGVRFNEAGEVDFGVKDLAQKIGEHATIALDHLKKDQKAGHQSQTENVLYSWDPDLLVFAIEAIQKALKKRRRTLPIQKFAQLVVLLYEDCQRSGRRDVGIAERVLRMIA